MHKRLAISIYSETKPKDINFHALYCIANMDPMVIKNINKQIKQIAIGKPVIVKFSRYNDYEHGELTSGEAEAAVKNLIVLNTRLVALQQWSPRRETKEIIERWENMKSKNITIELRERKPSNNTPSSDGRIYGIYYFDGTDLDSVSIMCIGEWIKYLHKHNRPYILRYHGDLKFYPTTIDVWYNMYITLVGLLGMGTMVDTMKDRVTHIQDGTIADIFGYNDTSVEFMSDITHVKSTINTNFRLIENLILDATDILKEISKTTNNPYMEIDPLLSKDIMHGITIESTSTTYKK